MPSRLVASARKLSVPAFEPYVCPSCYLVSLGGRSGTPRLPPQQLGARTVTNGIANTFPRPLLRPRGCRSSIVSRDTKETRRLASNGSLASSTAINAPSTVPPAFRELHQALQLLQDEASSYIDLSRIQLAARSLESAAPVVRVALLGLGANGALAARKLAKVLLSDPLNDEEKWEQELLESGKDGRSLLLRYGDNEDVVQHSPLVQTMHIPSPYLKRHNLEILVSTLNADGRSVDQVTEAEIEDAILVPPLATPTSAGGRVGFVRYPVHKALVVAEGIKGAIEHGRLPRFVDRATLIHSALSLPLRSSTGVKSAEQAATDNVVDIDLATHALGLFRTSRANGAQFSEEWQTSRLPVLSSWIAGPKEPEEVPMKFAVRQLLDSVLLNTAFAVARSEAEQVAIADSLTVPEARRSDLNRTISDWSADAHRDLQLNLNTALTSYTWRRTAWWRLLWRIDDVSVSAGDVLHLAWLTEAEQNLAFLSGRVIESGLATPQELKALGASIPVAEKDDQVAETEQQTWEPMRAQVITPADLPRTPTLISRAAQQQLGPNALFDPPWPQTIYLTRQQMLRTIVPSLHRKAQILLVSALSTIGGTTALGGWIFVAFSDLYTAGAVASLGLAWSLRRLQKLWGKERTGFTETLREDGRKVLAEVETNLWKVVREGGRAVIRPEDEQSWQKARVAIERCRDALEKIK
jgi:hypothetical protein